jgi:hypothetical protein
MTSEPDNQYTVNAERYVTANNANCKPTVIQIMRDITISLRNNVTAGQHSSSITTGSDEEASVGSYNGNKHD